MAAHGGAGHWTKTGGGGAGGGGRAAELLTGIDAPFKRVSTTNDRGRATSVYESENGLTVTFTGRPGRMWARVTQTSSGAPVVDYTSRPVKNQRVVLDAAREIGRQANFRIPVQRWNEIMAKGSESARNRLKDLGSKARAASVYK